MFTPDHPAEPIRRPALSMRLWGRVMHFACQHRNGFTLIEVMVVVVIIAILAGMMGVAVNSAKEKARQTACMSNLRQLGTAIVTYRADNRGLNPPWLSYLYPSKDKDKLNPAYIDDKRIYVCRSDPNRGRGVLRADDPTKYSEVIDNDSVTRHSLQNTKVMANSYFYEFSAAICSWGQNDDFVKRMYGDNSGGGKTWAEIKEAQLAFGNDGGPYSSSRLPIVRCYHHIGHGKIRKKGGGFDHITLNVAYAGNVVIAPLEWEKSVEPGDE
jgi:prepilin-type N-terminal cleavage/methylation domain-containing protein